MTAVFLIVIMGATRRGAPEGTAPVAIGLALTLIHLVSTAVTNTSVNPARSTSQAVFAAGDYALLYRFMLGVPDEDIARPVRGDPDAAVA